MKTFVKREIAVAFAALGLSAGIIGPTHAQLVQNPELLFVPIKPCRVLDTSRTSIIAANTTRSFSIAGTGSQFAAQGGATNGCGVPDLAAAVVISLTSGSATGPGGLTAFGGATASAPGTRLLSLVKNQNSTASVTIAVENKQIKVSTISAGTNLLGDITGYFMPQIQGLIEANGTVGAGTTRILSVSHASTGFYYVTLDRPARSCAPTAVAYNYGHYAAVGLSASNTPNIISVTTWNINTTGGAVLTDESFFLHVTC